MPEKKTQINLARAWPYVAVSAVAKDWANGSGTEHKVKMCKCANVQMCKCANVQIVMTRLDLSECWKKRLYWPDLTGLHFLFIKHCRTALGPSEPVTMNQQLVTSN